MGKDNYGISVGGADGAGAHTEPSLLIRLADDAKQAFSELALQI